MKKLFYCISILLLIAGLNLSLTAQPQYYNFNNGTGSNSFPFNMTGGKDVQLLYRAAEFNQPSPAPAGNIVSLSLRLSGAMNSVTYTELTIKMAQSTITDLTSGVYYTGPMTTVYYRASVNLTYPIGWATFTLDAPFAYDPTQSLIIDIGQCGASAGGGSIYFTTQTGLLRVWSVGGCPFVCYNSGSAYNYDAGITLGATGGPPIVTTTAATAITGNSATLNGTVNANNASTTVTFEYGLTTAYGTTISGVPGTVTGTTATPVNAAITGLNPNTLYHFRAKGVNSNGTTNGNDMTLTTLGPPATVVTTAATSITGTAATLNGTVNANNVSTTVSFEYGTTTAYGTTVAGVPPTITGSTTTPASAAITGLSGLTLYHFRIKGSNANGTSNGNDMTFTTSAAPPVVFTTAATGITGTTATLNGTVNASGFSTTAFFEYGLTTYYGSVAASVPSIITGTVTTSVLYTLTGLLPGVCYHYRVIASNAYGDSYGNDMTACTSPLVPTVQTYAATGVNSTVATMNGIVTANGPSTNIFFDYGPTVGYGTTVAGVPATASGNTPTQSSYTLTGLTFSATYHYRIRAVNSVGTSNGSDVSFTTGCFTAGPAGLISGPTQVCQGGTGYIYSVVPISNASGYVWTLPAGGSITQGYNTNSITVNYSQMASPGILSVYATAGCGNGSASQINIFMNSQPVPFITGPSSACINVPGNVYTTQAGMSNYAWTVSLGGSITAGGTNTSNTVTVTWITAGSKTVSVNYSNAAGCPGPAPTVYNVTANPLPVPVITGPSQACTGFPGQVYSTQTGMSGYTWSISAGGTITAGAGTNAITVTWNTAGSKTVSVNYSTPGGCTAAAPVVYPVTVNASPAPTITGPTNICVNSGYYNYSTESGMTGYTWTVSSGGTITFGGTTSTVQVNWLSPGAQWVRVNYTNGSGCQALNPVQFNVTVNSLPGSTGNITGSSAVCAGASGVAYSVSPVSGAANYIWTLPAGATNSTGASGNAIAVDFASNASSGNITVYANNICGNGASSPPFAVTVNSLPGNAGTITGPAAVCQGDAGAVYTVSIISGATGYSWTVPAGASIMSGGNTNSIVVDFGTTAVSGNITVKGTNSCGNGVVSPNLAVTVNAIPAAPVVSNTGTTLSSSSATGNQWYFSDTQTGTGAPIPGATDQTYTATQDGWYWSVVTLNGCASDESNRVQVITTGTGMHSATGINVSPNPNEGLFNVSITTSSAESFSISVYNNIGVKIFDMTRIVVDGSILKVIDLRPVSNGIYTLIIENSLNQVIRKIVVNK